MSAASPGYQVRSTTAPAQTRPAAVYARARTRPLERRQVRITRDGDDAIIAYADSKIATTHLKMGAERLAAMSDADVLTFSNEHLRANQELRNSHDYVVTEIPVGKPQVEYFEPGDQWVARG